MKASRFCAKRRSACESQTYSRDGSSAKPAGGSGAAMRRSLSRLAAIDADLTVYPGHGPSSTLAEEKRTNPYLRNAL